VYVGPDTSATHIAAATGTPTVALFGPTQTIRWAPWPKGWKAGADLWQLVGSGRRGNVYLVQGEAPCVPCHKEGCERHLESRSECLVTLPVNRVIGAVAEMLGLEPPPALGSGVAGGDVALVDTSALERRPRA
jgi:heptosyltransferase-3